MSTNISKVLERLRRYVEHESPSRDYARCAALAEIVAADARALGGNVELFDAQPNGKNVRARFGKAGGPPLLIIGHLDTVHPVGTLERQPFTIDEQLDRVTGPGVYDMKSGVVLMLEAVALLQSAGRLNREVTMLVTCDEEIGSHTSRELLEREARLAALVLVPEPSLGEGQVKTSRKGVATYTIKTRGRAAHAGIEPERGINAISELAHQIVALESVARPEMGTTISIGTTRGGTVTNTIPAEATATVDVRYATQEEAERVHKALTGVQPILNGAGVMVEQNEARPPLERTSRVISLYEKARAIAQPLGFDLGEGSTGGGSDGCLTAAVGTPTLDGLGPRGGGAHSTDEHVRLSDLQFRLAFYTALIEQL